jgi:opacity protein-like surface antigen
MKVQIACLSVLTALAVGPQLAAAADFGNVPPGGVINGGIRDYGGAGGVPVPAPVPIPEYKPSFYFRIDAGYGVLSNPTVTEEGGQYGWTTNSDTQNGYSSTFGNGPDLQAFDPAWLSTDFGNLVTYGAGVGYYIGSGWRMDATLEARSRDEININGSASFVSNGWHNDITGARVYDSDLDSDGQLGDRTTHVSIKDKTEIKGTVWMANMYYDLMKTDRGFTPYVGAGLGFVWNEMTRDHTTTVTSEATTGGCGCTRDYSKTTNTKTDTVSLAAALMAGASYQLTDISSLDVGYRFLYLGGTGFTSDVDYSASNISISDQYIHQLRAGLRFDVN